MKAMVFSDLITARNSFGALLGITLFVSAFIAVGTDTLIAAVACMGAMVPFMYLFSISAYDEQGGWEQFRLTLPLTRRQVAYGRYASMLALTGCAMVLALAAGLLIGAVAGALPAGMVPEGLLLGVTTPEMLVVAVVAVSLIILLSAAVTLPLIMRFGMTKGTRLVPVVMLLALSAVAGLLGTGLDTIGLDAVLTSGSIMMVMAVGAVVALSLYGASALLAARLYEQREL
ncbi:MAG: ABC-2 transporter permease [Eggerthellaceae bacterium]|jgi:ABC-2 type transport system permease protein|nr:ABC-2 transporter permease [Eggerthellaceae bacterium]